MEQKVKHYQELFGLTNWNINVRHFPTLNQTARTVADPRYYHATIDFKDENPEEWVILHEMIHVVMALYDFYCDNVLPMEHQEIIMTGRESVVSELTTIMMRIMK